MKSHTDVSKGVNAAGRAGRQASKAAHNRWVLLFARLGYATKGVVYLLIGWLAVQLAFGYGGGAATDKRGALQSLSGQPGGKILLIVITIGLIAFALWCFIQAIFDTEGKGHDAKGIVTRIVFAAIGISYASLALGAFQLVMGAASAGKNSTNQTQHGTSLLLDHPFGIFLVVLIGLVVIGVACYLFYKAYSANFQQTLNLNAMGTQVKKGIIFLGRGGYSAFGVVFAIIGLFLIIAAVKHQPGDAKGLDGALLELQKQPFGQVLLIIVALGLIAYGAYSFAEARYRRVG